MKTLKLNLRMLLLVTVIASFAFSGTSCKAKKEAAEKARIEAAKVKKAVAELNALLIDEVSTPDQLQTKLDAIKLRKIQNSEVKGLIDLNQKRIDNKKTAIEKAKKEADEKAEKEKKVVILKTDEQLDLYLQKIASAPTAAEANSLIEKVYDMFSSKTADVLIIIAKSASGQPDYDKPTNIRDYLNYVKDQKLYSKKVENLELDGNGKIKLLELLNR